MVKSLQSILQIHRSVETSMDRTVRSGSDRSVDVLRQSGLRLLDERLEGVRVLDGHLGEGAAVKLDACQTQTLHEAVVGHALGADGGVDALDPELAELAPSISGVGEVIFELMEQLILSGGV